MDKNDPLKKIINLLKANQTFRCTIRYRDIISKINEAYKFAENLHFKNVSKFNFSNKNILKKTIMLIKLNLGANKRT